MTDTNVSCKIENITNMDLYTAKELSRKEIRANSTGMTSSEARYLVDFYYIAQRERIRFDNQIRAMSAVGEPNRILSYLSEQSAKREALIKKALDDYTIDHPVGAWLRTIRGIGPVTAAGLLAYIDINKAPTAGAIWKYAGIDGKSVWNKGEKRPWNATFKTIVTYKIGESFVKTSNKEDSYYGKLYKERKALDTKRNLNGEFADQAKNLLATRNYTKGTVTYKALSEGRLSDAHIHARARRYAVKIFLSHLHEVMYKTILGKNPPVPFAIAILGHAHMLEVPNPHEIREFVEPIEIEHRDCYDEGDE